MGYPEYHIDNLNHVQGVVHASLWSELNCTMRLYTFNRERYAKEIIELKVKVKELKKKLVDTESEMYKIVNQEGEYKAELQSYQRQLRELEAQMVVFKDDYIRIDEYKTK